MDSIQFDSNIGKPVEMNLIFDGEQRGKIQIMRMIPYGARADMIQSVIDSVVFDGMYHPYHFHFALGYQLILFYSDVILPDLELKKGDDESDEAFAARQNNASLSNAFEFMARSNILEMLRANIIGYGDLVDEIQAGIEFAKKKILNDTPLNRLGDKIQDLFDAARELVESEDVLSVLADVAQTAITTTDDNKEE